MKKLLFFTIVLFGLTACFVNEPVTISVTHVVLSHNTLELTVGETATLFATVMPRDAENQNITWTSSSPTVATVNNNGEVRARAAGTTTITVITEDGEMTTTCTVTVERVPDVEVCTSLDGVVIDGIRWATRNVDAPGTFAETPESAGMFFQWNRRIGWSTTGFVVGWDFIGAQGLIWTRANDPCPQGWRVPTEEELFSLRNADNVRGRRNEVYGRVFGTAPYQIFLPAAGARRYNGVLIQVGYLGYYWASTPRGWPALNLSFRSGWPASISIITRDRSAGASVRCVAEKN